MFDNGNFEAEEDNDDSDDGEGTNNQISNAGDGLIDNENNDNDEGKE